MQITKQSLERVVALAGERVSQEEKDPSWSYIGLEHIAQGTPTLHGAAPSSTSKSTNSVFQSGDILFGKLRPYLRKCVQVDFSGYCSTDILVLRPRSGVYPKYAAKVLQQDEVFDAAVRTSIGTRMPRTSWKQLKHYEVFLPPLPEQRRIAAVLDTVDAAIQQTDAVIAKLKQVKQGLLHDLLTRGLDAEGRLRDPERHPEQFKDSPLGRIPKAWEFKRVGDLARLITSGSRGWAKYYARTGAIFLRIGNLTRKSLDLYLDDLVFVDLPEDKQDARSKVQGGDILISITADLGIIGVVPPNTGPAYINQHISLVRAHDEPYLSKWMGYYLAGEAGQKQFYQLNDAGAKSGLNLTSVSNLRIPIPTESERAQIVRAIEAQEHRTQSDQAYRTKLRQLKAGLMQDLLTGRVRVPEAEVAIAEVVL